MKKQMISSLLAMIIGISLLSGCEPTISDEEKSYTETAKQQALDMVGFPNITNFFELSQLKEIYEMRDNPNLICHWYTKNDMSGKWIYQGTCIGYGIPYGVSQTSPEQYRYEGATLPLAEPNGLYTNSLSTSATWILVTDDEGNIKPTYAESEILVSQMKVEARLCEDWSLPSDY